MGHRLACLAFSLLAVTTNAHADTVPPDIIPWNDWPVVEAAAEPPRTETMTPHRIWRLDCGEAADLLVGRITAAAPGPDGRVLLVDRQLTSVIVVGPDGTVEGTQGTRGEGPGEVHSIYRTLALADGRVGFVSGTAAPGYIFGGRPEIVFNDAAGDPAGVWSLVEDSGTTPVVTARDLRHARGHVLVTLNRAVIQPPLLQEWREMILLGAPDGVRTLVAASVSVSAFTDMDIHERDAFEPWANGCADVDTAGRIATACERDRWRVVVFGVDGAGVVIARDVDPVIRTEAAMEKVRADLGVGGRGDVTVLKTEPMITRVCWRPDGRLWVEPSVATRRDGVLACFDEFEADGRFVRRVEMVLPGEPVASRLCLLEDGRFVLLRGFGEGDADPDVVLLAE